MNAQIKSILEDCSRGSEENRLTFPQVLQTLKAAGVEGYYADIRRAVKIYYLPCGESVEIPASKTNTPVAEAFDGARVDAAVRQSQAGAHTYKDFREKIAAAGCAGYVVSLPGHRTVYFGRTAETHVEHFPAIQ